MGGRNLPPGWDRVNLSENLGKAAAYLTIDYASDLVHTFSTDAFCSLILVGDFVVRAGLL